MFNRPAFFLGNKRQIAYLLRERPFALVLPRLGRLADLRAAGRFAVLLRAAVFLELLAFLPEPDLVPK
ncbi:MAG: hypothetical protein ACRDFQ_01305 [Anaerolineales bacterium]